MATAFDTLAISRSIRDAGVDERAAEAITHAIAAAISREREDLATKGDLKAEVARLDSKIELSEQRLIAKMGELNNRTMIAMLTVGGLIVAAIKLF